MANLRIYIEAIEEKGKYKLKLSDSEGNEGIDHLVSTTKPGAKVKWEMKRHAEIKIKEITKIGAKDGSDDIFGKSLKRVGKNWRGVVKDSMWDKKEDYFIHYKIKGVDDEQICDPSVETPPPP